MGHYDDIRKQILIDKSEFIHFETSEVIAAATVASVFGSQIRAGMKRNFWSLIVSPRSASAQQLQITTGDAVSGFENVLNLRQEIPAAALELLSGDPLKPNRRTAPVLAAGTNDRTVATHETDAIDLDVSYYDTPLFIRNFA